MQRIGPGPVAPDAPDQRRHLGIGEQPTSALGEGRHQRTGDAVPADPGEHLVVGDGEVHRIGERQCRAPLPLRPVTAGAIRREERGKVQHLIRDALRRSGHRAARRTTSRGDQQQRQRGQGTEAHRGRSRPEASIPARIESGRAVLTRCCRDTTRPATSPKPNCESTNQNQSTRLFITGLTMPRIP